MTTIIQKTPGEGRVSTQAASPVRLAAGKGTKPLAPDMPITDGTEHVLCM